MSISVRPLRTEIRPNADGMDSYVTVPNTRFYLTTHQTKSLDFIEVVEVEGVIGFYFHNDSIPTNPRNVGVVEVVEVDGKFMWMAPHKFGWMRELCSDHGCDCAGFDMEIIPPGSIRAWRSKVRYGIRNS